MYRLLIAEDDFGIREAVREFFYEINNDLTKRIEALASDLNYCRGIDRESVEYREEIVLYAVCIAAAGFMRCVMHIEATAIFSYYYLRTIANLMPLMVMFSSFRAWRWFSGRMKKL